MKKILFTIFLILITISLFAGGEAETGRSTAADQAAGGQLLPVGSIDPGNYLSDFECKIINKGSDPLLVRVEPLQKRIWEKGGLTAFRILLAVNDEAFFPQTPGLFVLFFQNPEILRNEAFVNDLKKLVIKHKGLDIRIFDYTEKELWPASSYTDLMTAVNAIKYKPKNYHQNILIQRVLGTMSQEDVDRAHLLWITDENIAENLADLRFFDFAVELLAGTHTTFSYLAYGELPNWPAINNALLKRNGNSYYADSLTEIPGKIEKDLGYFHRPAVEEIEITIDLGKTTYEKNVFYPQKWYGTPTGFYPVITNNRPRSLHTLGGMNYNEIKRFIHYVHIPSYTDQLEMPDPTPLLENDRLKVGTVFIKYFMPMNNRWDFLQQDIFIDYVDSEGAGNLEINKEVELDVLIQNTPLIILEAAQIVNKSRNYLLALKLLQAQRSLLKEFGEVRPDEAINEDMETLEKLYETVFAQAKANNLLE